MSSAPGGAVPSNEDLVHRDELTGLYNRRFYNARYRAEGEAAAAGGRPLGLLMIDLDYFKSINDRFGHSVGDGVLEFVGRRLREAVGEDGLPIRYAGDEFAVLAPGATRETALALARRLVETLRAEPFPMPDGPPRTLTLSVGVASYPEDTDDPATLFDRADRAVYVAKKGGRDQAAAWEPEQALVLDRVSLLRQFPCPKLVDRADLMGRLLQHLFPAFDRRLAIVMLQGPSGVGKSRLLSDLRDQADPQRLTVLLAGGLPYLASQPFGYLCDALGKVVRGDPRMAGLMAAALTPGDRLAVARLLPDLSRHTLLDSSSEEDRAELPRAFALMLLALAREKRLILLMDDFQWVDPGTLATLTLLCEMADRNSIAIMVAMRSEGLETVSEEESSAREAALRDFIGRMIRSSHLAGFPVPPLSRKGVAEMLSAILPPLSDHAELLDLVHQKSDGLPLLVEEILRHLILREYVSPTEDGQGLSFRTPDEEIPASSELLERFQVDVLDEEVRASIARLATAGTEFDFATAQAVESMDEGRLRGILEKAKSQRLILERFEDDIEKFEFISESAREAMTALLPEAERRHAHGRVARHKEQQRGGAVDPALADLAYHFGQAGDTEQAQRYSQTIKSRYGDFAAPSDLVMVGKSNEAKDLAASRQLTEEELKLGLDLARQFRVVARTGRMYGSDAEQVREQIQAFHEGVTQFLTQNQSLDFSQVGKNFLINGCPLPAAARAAGMALILEDAQVKALSFKRGLVPSEIETLVKALLVKKEDMVALGGLGRFLKDYGVQNIVPNEKIFVHVAEQDILLKRRDSDEAVILKDLDALRKTMDVPDFEFALDSDTAELVRGGAPGVAVTEAGSHEVRASGAPTPGAPMERSELLRLQSEIRAWYEEVSKYVDLSFLETISGDWKVLCKDLESGNRVKMAAACKAFMERGPEAVDPLLSFVALTDDPRARKLALHMVGKLVPDSAERLVHRIFTSSQVEETVRLLDALEDLEGPTDALVPRLEPFVCHGDSQVRKAAIEALARMNWRALERNLLDAAGRKADLELRLDALEAVGAHQVLSARAQLIALCRRRSIFFADEHPHLQEAACMALGGLGGNDETFRVLTGALGRAGLLWRTKPSRVRAAAAMALGRAATPGDHAVHATLERWSKDSDPAVRSACKVALTLAREELAASRSG